MENKNEDKEKLFPPKQNRLKGKLKRGEKYIVRHRKGTEKVKIMKGVELQKDIEVKVKNLENKENKNLKIVLCHFKKLEGE